MLVLVLGRNSALERSVAPPSNGRPIGWRIPRPAGRLKSLTDQAAVPWTCAPNRGFCGGLNEAPTPLWLSAAAPEIRNATLRARGEEMFARRFRPLMAMP